MTAPLPPADAELAALRRLSAELGREPSLIQAAGGNTSLKRDGLMWIKASGTWLAEALDRDIMLPIGLAPLLRARAAGEARAERAEDFVPEGGNPSGLRPSIETTVHAVMPQRVVIHVHCVETLAYACLADGAARLAPLLAGLDWAWIPYVRPGLPLAAAIVERRQPTTDVLVLGNHGLVVAGDTVAEAEALLRQVVDRIRRPVRQAPPPDIDRLERLASGSAYRLPRDAAAHAVATDPASCRIAASGSLYPDHVIFLGPGAAVLDGGALPPAAAAGAPDGPLFLLVPGAGLLLHRRAVAGADALARCLADVAARIAGDAEPTYLSAAQERDLTDWDAEKYRQSLNAVEVP